MKPLTAYVTSTITYVTIIVTIVSSQNVNNPNNNNLRNGNIQPPQLSNQWNLLDIIPPNYNNQQPPMINRSPVDVELNLAIISFHKIDENQQSFIADVFLHKKWIDPRLKFPRLIRDNTPNNRDLSTISPNFSRKIVLNSQWLNRIWTPAINFRNARSSAVSNTLNPTVYITISNTSEVFMAAKMSLDLNCNFDFSKYPFDSQNCHIEITSLSQPLDVVNLKWGKFEITKNLYLPQFRVEREYTMQERCVNSYKTVGSFSCLRAKFKLVRNVGNFIISRYAPSFLIVCLAFTGFWVPTSAYPARVGLCLSSILSLTTLQYQNTLNVSYIYALNIWMAICTLFVFLCLIQYSFAISDWSNLSFKKKGKYSMSSSSTNVVNISNNGNVAGHDDDHDESKKKNMLRKRLRKFIVSSFEPTDRNNRVDMISRFIFPFSFLSTTIIYFLIYMT